MNETPPPSWTRLSPSVISSAVHDGCRFAKDQQYLTAVLNEWRKEESTWTVPVEMRPIIYSCNESQDSHASSDNLSSMPMFGHVVRPQSTTLSPSGIVLLFHTAAGPHDVFLLWKASSLASNLGCLVMICDVLGDEEGWGWDTDKTRYTTTRDKLLRDDGLLLRTRVKAALQTIRSIDENRKPPLPIACMGWCLGAQPVIELSRLEGDTSFPIVALSTFHGVFHRPDMALSGSDPNESPTSTGSIGTKLLMFNGVSDPFVSQDDLNFSKKMFQNRGYHVTIRQFENSKHGFSNPAQRFNPHEAFGYNEEAANESWNEAIQLLREQFKLK